MPTKKPIYFFAGALAALAISCPASCAADTALAIKAAPLDLFSSLAAIAVAVSLAYAALPNFRHRKKVQEFIRNQINDAKHGGEALIDLVKANERTEGTVTTCNHWAIVFRLAGLREMNGVPQPKKTKDRGADRHFANSSGYKLFSRLYASNLDKVLSVAMGVFAGSSVWFGTIDHVNFIEPLIGNKERDQFLAGIMSFYLTMFSLMFGSLILHSIFWSADAELNPTWRKSVNFVLYTMGAIFIFLMFLSSIREMMFSEIVFNYFGSNTSYWLMKLIESALLFTIFLPVYLHWQAGRVTKEMEMEGKAAIDGVMDVIIREIRPPVPSVPTSQSRQLTILEAMLGSPKSNELQRARIYKSPSGKPENK